MIYHLFPGKMEHHVPDMIQYFLDNRKALGLEANEQLFVVFGAEPSRRGCYDRLGLSERHLQFYPSPSLTRSFFRRIRREDGLILHSVFFPLLWASLAFVPALWKRMAVINWGAGFEKRNPRTVRGQVNIVLRKIILPRLAAISTMTPGEFRAIERDYGPCRNYVRAVYCDIFYKVSEPKEREGKGPLRVLLGHSSDETNGHVEALQWLRGFRDEDLEIVCPLGYPSYPAALAHREKVLQAGHEVFQGKFHPILEMIPKKEYIALLDGIDVYVSNTVGQQGLFNVYYLLALGRKIFLRRDCSIFEMLREHDVWVGDTLGISRQTFGAFGFQPAETIAHNMERLRTSFSREAVCEGWKTLLARIQGRPAQISSVNGIRVINRSVAEDRI